MRKMKQFVSLLLISAMLLTSGASVNAFEPPSSAEEAIQSGFSSSENAYAIYPIPQNITYSENGEFQLDETVNVVSENGIDSYTNDFLSEILTDYSRTESKTESIPETGSKILLGIKGSGGAVDQWANNNLSLKDADLFTKTKRRRYRHFRKRHKCRLLRPVHFTDDVLFIRRTKISKRAN